MFQMPGSKSKAPRSTSQLPGTQSTDAANAGNVGEYISSTLASGSAVGLTSAVAANITSIVLTPGDWDVSGVLALSGNAATTMTFLIGSISTTSVTVDSTPGRSVGMSPRSDTFGQTTSNFHPIVGNRISLAVPTTIYLVALVGFAVNTCSAFGMIQARRRR